MSGLRFCSKCDNLLYPKEKQTDFTLMFECKSCGNREDAEDVTKPGERVDIVYQNVLRKTATTKLEHVDPAVIFDPCLPRTDKIRCKRCNNNSAVFFQADSGRDSDMALVFVCTKCREKWLN